MNKTKKLIALGCSVSLVLTGITGCNKKDDEAAGAQMSQAVEDVEAIEDALGGLAGTDLIKHSSTAGKEETVYVMMDGDGNQNSVIVSEWLKNPEGTDALTDTSNLQNLRVVKGTADYKQDGEKLTWTTGGSDVYYQGTSEAALPITVKISYELDGKKVTAKELDGASGHLKITFDYENNTGTQREIHGENRTIYQPFMVISGMMFDNEKVMNVEVSDGKTINSGDLMLVFGVAMPGLADSLGLDEFEDEDGKKIDIDIPDQVVVDADVTDFSLLMTLSIVSNNALEQLGLDDFDSLDDLKEDMDKLTDGMDDIIDGATQLRDGVQELSDGTGELSDGTDDLQSGAESLSDGAHELLNGTSKVSTGVNQLKKGIDDADAGAKKLKAGMDQLQEKIPALSTGVSDLQKGMTQLSGGLKTLDESLSDPAAQAKLGALKNGSASVKSGLTSASDGLDAIVAGYNPESGDVKALIEGLEAYAAGLEASGDATNAAYAGYIRSLISTYKGMYGSVGQVKTGVNTLNASYPAIDDGINNMITNMGTISTNVHAMSSGASDLKDGVDQMNAQLPALASGIGDLSAGMTTLSEGTGKLKTGAAKLKDGTDDLKDGALQLAEGAGKLYDGTSDLKNGVKELVDGVGELLDGSGELKDGVVKFNDEGITKLSDLVNDDLEKFYDRLKAVKDYGGEYETFGGCNEDVECSVQFIYKTEGIGQ